MKSTTDTHYAWTEKNTAPALPSNESRREKVNGFLAVELGSGKTTVDFQAQAKTENAVAVLALVVLRYVQLGFEQITFILDNCRIHGAKMKTALAELLAQIPQAQDVTVAFLHTPAYSPQFNPAEYVIHLVRQQALYHLPAFMTVEARAERVNSHLAQAPPITPQQIKNILRHIYRLPKTGWS